MTSNAPTRALLVTVRGAVQGVGFRPFVHRLARRHGLAGSVSNRGGAVRIEVEGPSAAVEAFVAEVRASAPALARVDDVAVAERAPRGGRAGFDVEGSAPAGGGELEAGEVPPDVAPCPDCLRELADRSDRRFAYPFLSCTACGPRYTVSRQLPYDRAATSLAAFPPCARCRAEYLAPLDRRFHAEGIVCPSCGPALELAAGLTAGGARAAGRDALERARALVRAGGVLALKGVGGYQLACLATDAGAVARLRARKRRPHKPLALCARDLEQAGEVALLVAGAAEALLSPERPIVLLPRRASVPDVVAPGLREVGVMLPASPLHALLLQDEPAPWVLTSGNVHGEPVLTDDAEARARLAGVADGFLAHGREIVARADDSVVQLHRGRARVLRRARGYAPRSIALPASLRDAPDLVAVGADLKATVCVAARGRATLSPHVGDLGPPAAEAALRAALDHLLRLTGARPRAVACDLHPDHATSRVARDLGLPVVEVQHHHAHAAACLVEHGLAGPALALALDGTGHGADGTPWGGELLAVDLRAAERLGRLRPVALPGGDAAAREPWRCAVAHLTDAGVVDDGAVVEAFGGEASGVEASGGEASGGEASGGEASGGEASGGKRGRLEPRRVEAVRRLLAAGVACPRASSAGRLFDAVAALCGLRAVATYEGQAAAELEALAADAPDEPPYPADLRDDAASRLLELDTRPLVRAAWSDRRTGVPPAAIAARFHAGLARGLAAAARRARDATGLDRVLLVGGVFQNRRLLGAVEDLLRADGLHPLHAGAFPPGDGGLSLGQAAVAAARIGSASESPSSRANS